MELFRRCFDESSERLENLSDDEYGRLFKPCTKDDIKILYIIFSAWFE